MTMAVWNKRTRAEKAMAFCEQMAKVADEEGRHDIL